MGFDKWPPKKQRELPPFPEIQEQIKTMKKPFFSFKKTFLLLLFSVPTFILFTPKTASAVPPPDFIFSVASQVASFFAIALAFLSAFFTISYQFLKNYFTLYRKHILIGGIIVIFASAGAGAYFYDQYYQKNTQQIAYEKWLDESREIAEKQPETTETHEKANEGERLKIKRPPTSVSLKVNPDDGENPEPPESPEPPDPPVPPAPEDPGITFIKQYYQNIANHNFQEAYNISKKSVPFETFSGWYQTTDQINIDDIIKIDHENFSLELTLTENEVSTRYGVLMALNFDAQNLPLNIKNSQVQILKEIASKTAGKTPAPPIPPGPSGTFWENYQSIDLAVTNEDFQKSLSSNLDNYLLLDARENIEFENGFLPSSTHIRFADLQAGRWLELPQDKFVYVICWSGIRGKEVAEFLRKKELVSRYLEKGADGWVKFGGEWEEELHFNQVYSADRYKLVFSTDEVKQKIEEGVKLIDCRPPTKFNASHLPDSVNIPLMYTPTSELEEAFAQLSPGGQIITICDDYVNCFDAKLTGVELERRGYTFLGRFSKPWDF